MPTYRKLYFPPFSNPLCVEPTGINEFRNTHIFGFFPYFTGADIQLLFKIKYPRKSKFKIDILEYSWRLLNGEQEEVKYADVGRLTRSITDDDILRAYLKLPHLNKATHYNLQLQVKLGGTILQEWDSILDFDLLNKDKIFFDFVLGIAGLVIGTAIGTLIGVFIQYTFHIR
jgi:hypothetical protein